MSDIDEDGHKVGYGKPPVHSRFHPGQSGNPKGRPPGRKNLATLVQKLFHEQITVTENGSIRQMSKGEATLRQLFNQGMKGDLRASREVIKLCGYAEQIEAKEPDHEDLDEKDRAAMARLKARMEAMTNNREVKK